MTLSFPYLRTLQISTFFYKKFKIVFIPFSANFPQKTHGLPIPVNLPLQKYITHLHISVAVFMFLSLPVMPLPLHTLAHVTPYMAKFQWLTFNAVLQPMHFPSLLHEPKNVYKYIFIYLLLRLDILAYL